MNLNDLLIDIIDTQIDVETQGLCLNAANIQTGDVFVALQGQSTHGIDYIDQAIENGCVAVLVDSQDFDCSVPSVRIDNLRQHLPVLASTYYYEAAQVEVIGVTGTNGKTSVSYFISQLLNQLGVKNGLVGTLGVTHSDAVSNNTTAKDETYLVVWIVALQSVNGIFDCIWGVGIVDPSQGIFNAMHPTRWRKQMM